ncbi:hypothetical protein [Methylorubrum salsuginis]|uniref:Uncharacterized protein n=1 Tax=Methylorubrum salsuginis TaxID=414703 RepID=A0A1I4DCD8_9HYPH|nr:hypothetical protein [Methylorubrum salsuginis]SFK89591.1 hypothetical protein SAMN04488125_105239 [Methylorubrum salsuginis]
MTTVARAMLGMTVRAVGMPRGAGRWAPPTAANAEGTIEDGYRHQSIGSLQALGLAVAASMLLTGLLWIAL